MLNLPTGWTWEQAAGAALLLSGYQVCQPLTGSISAPKQLLNVHLLAGKVKQILRKGNIRAKVLKLLCNIHQGIKGKKNSYFTKIFTLFSSIELSFHKKGGCRGQATLRYFPA